MFKKIDKVLAALGNIKAMERLHVDTITETKIEKVDGDLLGRSDHNMLFSKPQELNGYLFLEVLIICTINIKTFKGATLHFTGGSENFTLTSDTQEIESEFSNVSNRFISQITFDVTTAALDKIDARDYTQITFNFKKKQLNFDMVPVIV